MDRNRFQLVNLGRLGWSGDSVFSLVGVPFASDLIEQGWIPCGTSINADGEVLQTFYLPFEEDSDA